MDSGAEALYALAARLMQGGLRLSPRSDALWALAGEMAAEQSAAVASLTNNDTAAAGIEAGKDDSAAAALAGRAEFCLSRALTLNPQRGSAWAALARLYAARGRMELAAAAAERCRLVEPRLVAAWEALAALAAPHFKARHVTLGVARLR
jgi:tetratricopeptide (TPR) repeat protein